MSEEMVNDLVNIIGLLDEAGVLNEAKVHVVNRDAVIEILRGIIQDEWMRTGVLAVVE